MKKDTTRPPGSGCGRFWRVTPPNPALWRGRVLSQRPREPRRSGGQGVPPSRANACPRWPGHSRRRNLTGDALAWLGTVAGRGSSAWPRAPPWYHTAVSRATSSQRRPLVFKEALAAGARRVPVDRSRLELGSTAALHRFVQPEDQRTGRHERRDEQVQQDASGGSRGPAHPVEEAMVVLEVRVTGQAEGTQDGGENRMSRGEQRAAEQRLRAPPTRTKKNRSESCANSLHFGGWCKHGGESLWKVIFPTVYPPAPVAKLDKVELRPASESKRWKAHRF